MANIIQLNKDVAAQYELVNWTGGHRQHFGKFGIVDLQAMTLQQAESLVRRKFTKLRLKNKAGSTDKATTK